MIEFFSHSLQAMQWFRNEKIVANSQEMKTSIQCSVAQRKVFPLSFT